MDRRVLAAWLKCGFMEKAVGSATEEGRPQGGIISPTLANFALDGLEKFLPKTFYRTMRNGKLPIKPSAANYSACIGKIRTIIKSHKTAKQPTLIKKLNPVIQGWANLHRHVVAKRYFQPLNSDIWRALWR